VICVGTPHLGSPVATILDEGNPLEHLSRLVPTDTAILQELGANLDAVHDLSRPAAEAFNAACPDNSQVDYVDVAGIGRKGLFHTSKFFQLTSAFLVATSGVSDGIVPLASATRGRKPFAVWPGDHADLIGHDLNDVPAFRGRAFDHLTAYRSLVSDVIVPNDR
jgi:hypothetical protein